MDGLTLTHPEWSATGLILTWHRSLAPMMPCQSKRREGVGGSGWWLGWWGSAGRHAGGLNGAQAGRRPATHAIAVRFRRVLGLAMGGDTMPRALLLCGGMVGLLR